MLPSQLNSLNIVLTFPLSQLKSFRTELKNVPGIYGLYRINPVTGLIDLFLCGTAPIHLSILPIKQGNWIC